MMVRRLAVNVVDRDPDSGQVVVFEAGTVPPVWAADRITNPDAWAPADLEHELEAPAGSPAATPDPERETPAGAPDPAGTSSGASEEIVDEPPRSGKGSGKAAWAAYLVAHGLDPAGLDRDAMISLVDQLAELAATET
jgi:hypothetical protein